MNRTFECSVLQRTARCGTHLIVFVLASLLTGCGDAIRTTVQTVRLEVTSWSSSLPAPGVEAALRYDPDANPSTEGPSRPDPTGVEWQFGTTDALGQVQVPIRWMTLHTLGSTPPPADVVTGRSYFIRIAAGGDAHQQSGVLVPEARIHVGGFIVRVLEIGAPRYVETP